MLAEISPADKAEYQEAVALLEQNYVPYGQAAQDLGTHLAYARTVISRHADPEGVDIINLHGKPLIRKAFLEEVQKVRTEATSNRENTKETREQTKAEREAAREERAKQREEEKAAAAAEREAEKVRKAQEREEKAAAKLARDAAKLEETQRKLAEKAAALEAAKAEQEAVPA